MGMMFLVLGLAGYACFAYQPRPRMAFNVSEARLRADAAHAVRANNMMEG